MTAVEELTEVVLALHERLERIEALVLPEEDERPATLAEARAALLARAKERRKR